jgi:hypothetical protein
MEEGNRIAGRMPDGRKPLLHQAPGAGRRAGGVAGIRRCGSSACRGVTRGRSARLGFVSAKPFIVALILGTAAALFVYRDRAAAWFPKGENLPDRLGAWQVQATITLLVVIGLAYMLSD